MDARFLTSNAWVRLCLQVALVAIPLVLLPEGFQFAHYPKVLVLQLVLVVLSVLVLHSGVTLVSASVSLYLIWTVAGTWFSLNPWSAGLLLLTQTGAMGVGLIVASRTPARGDDALLWGLAIGGGLMSAVGLVEYAGVDWLPSAGRPSATMGFRNIAATVAAGSLPAAFCLSTQRGVRRIVGGIATCVIALFVLYARSRGAYLGVGVAALYGILYGFRHGFPPLSRLAPAALAALVVIGLSGVSPRYEDESAYRLDERKASLGRTVGSFVEKGGDRNRLAIWNHTWDMILDHPTIGVGLGNWSTTYPKYDRGDVMHIQSAPRRPHNDVLWVWAELGLVGVGLFLWILYGAFQRREREGHWVVFQCVVIVVFVHGLFSFPREQAAPALMFWVAMGALHRGHGWRIQGTRARVVAFVLLFLGCAGGWGAYRATVFDRHYAQAQAFQRMGERQAQVEHARAALAWGTFDHRVSVVLGEGLTDLGDPEGAADVYRKYVELEPHLPAALNNLGNTLIQLNEYAEAEPVLRAAAEVLPGDERIRNNLAEALRRQERRDEALALFEGIDRLSANDHHTLGVLYGETSRLAEARGHYARALQLEPNLHEVIFSLAGIDLLEGNLSESAAGYERFLNVWEGHPTYVRRARNRLRQVYPELARQQVLEGQVNAAAEVYERYAGLGDAEAAPLHAYAMVLARLGRIGEGLDAGRNSNEADTTYVPIYLTMGQLNEAAGDSVEAARYYRGFLRRWEEPGPQRSLAESRLRALSNR